MEGGSVGDHPPASSTSPSAAISTGPAGEAHRELDRSKSAIAPRTKPTTYLALHRRSVDVPLSQLPVARAGDEITVTEPPDGVDDAGNASAVPVPPEVAEQQAVAAGLLHLEGQLEGAIVRATLLQEQEGIIDRPVLSDAGAAVEAEAAAAAAAAQARVAHAEHCLDRSHREGAGAGQAPLLRHIFSAEAASPAAAHHDSLAADQLQQQEAGGEAGEGAAHVPLRQCVSPAAMESFPTFFNAAAATSNSARSSISGVTSPTVAIYSAKARTSAIAAIYGTDMTGFKPNAVLLEPPSSSSQLDLDALASPPVQPGAGGAVAAHQPHASILETHPPWQHDGVQHIRHLPPAHVNHPIEQHQTHASGQTAPSISQQGQDHLGAVRSGVSQAGPDIHAEQPPPAAHPRWSISQHPDREHGPLEQAASSSHHLHVEVEHQTGAIHQSHPDSHLHHLADSHQAGHKAGPNMMHAHHPATDHPQSHRSHATAAHSGLEPGRLDSDDCGHRDSRGGTPPVSPLGHALCVPSPTHVACVVRSGSSSSLVAIAAPANSPPHAEKSRGAPARARQPPPKWVSSNALPRPSAVAPRNAQGMQPAALPPPPRKPALPAQAKARTAAVAAATAAAAAAAAVVDIRRCDGALPALPPATIAGVVVSQLSAELATAPHGVAQHPSDDTERSIHSTRNQIELLQAESRKLRQASEKLEQQANEMQRRSRLGAVERSAAAKVAPAAAPQQTTVPRAASMPTEHGGGQLGSSHAAEAAPPAPAGDGSISYDFHTPSSPGVISWSLPQRHQPTNLALSRYAPTESLPKPLGAAAAASGASTTLQPVLPHQLSEPRLVPASSQLLERNPGALQMAPQLADVGSTASGVNSRAPTAAGTLSSTDAAAGQAHNTSAAPSPIICFSPSRTARGGASAGYDQQPGPGRSSNLSHVSGRNIRPAHALPAGRAPTAAAPQSGYSGAMGGAAAEPGAPRVGYTGSASAGPLITWVAAPGQQAGQPVPSHMPTHHSGQAQAGVPDYIQAYNNIMQGVAPEGVRLPAAMSHVGGLPESAPWLTAHSGHHDAGPRHPAAVHSAVSGPAGGVARQPIAPPEHLACPQHISVEVHPRGLVPVVYGMQGLAPPPLLDSPMMSYSPTMSYSAPAAAQLVPKKGRPAPPMAPARHSDHSLGGRTPVAGPSPYSNVQHWRSGGPDSSTADQNQQHHRGGVVAEPLAYSSAATSVGYSTDVSPPWGMYGPNPGSHSGWGPQGGYMFGGGAIAMSSMYGDGGYQPTVSPAMHQRAEALDVLQRERRDAVQSSVMSRLDQQSAKWQAPPAHGAKHAVLSSKQQHSYQYGEAPFFAVGMPGLYYDEGRGPPPQQQASKPKQSFRQQQQRQQRGGERQQRGQEGCQPEFRLF